MEPIVGRGKYTHKVHEDWARLPEGLEMRACGRVAGPGLLLQ